MTVEEHVFDLLAAYSLGCLDEEETLMVSKHLENCKVCQGELVSYQSVTNRLGLAAPGSIPPPELKQKVIKNLPSSQKVISQPTGRSRWGLLTRFGAVTFGAIGLVVIFALAFSNIYLWRQVNQLRMSPAQDFKIVSLSSTDFAPQASGMLVISADGEHGTLIFDKLPQLDSGHQYQLWLIKDGKRTSVGVFSVGEGGYGSLWVESKIPLADYSGFGITIEPQGGSPGPTGEKVLGGEL